MDKICFLVVFGWLAAANILYADVAADWKSYTANTASGEIDGIAILATTSGTSPFIGIVNNRWVSGGSGGWDANGLELNAADLALVAADVNGGDHQEFSFNQPFEGYLYIENFDSSAVASVTATGATSLSLLTGSASISYTATGADSGNLMTSNPTFDGEGDVVLALEGPVTSVRLDYTAGEEANGVFYTFAQNSPATAVVTPEPTTVFLALLATLSVAVFRRNRCRN